MSAAASATRPAAEVQSAGHMRRMECRICWQVYNPQQGDELGQIAPGTPFSELPDDWHCPRCDADKSCFLSYD
jgi:rubredoxin